MQAMQPLWGELLRLASHCVAAHPSCSSEIRKLLLVSWRDDLIRFCQRRAYCWAVSGGVVMEESFSSQLMFRRYH